jgi:hypothetical protein
MKRTIIALLIIGATAAYAKDLTQLYEKAYFLETAKGEQESALKIYRDIAGTAVTDENRSVIINTLNRMLHIYSGPTGDDLQTELARLNLDFERGVLAEMNPAPALWGGGGQGYEIVADSSEKQNGNYSCRIRQTGQGTFGAITGSIDPKLLAGRKIRLSGHMKLDDVSGMAGLWIRADQDQKPAAFYNMSDRKLNGSKGWKFYSFEIAIPGGVDNINFGALVSGSGTLWVDDISIQFID